MSATKLDELTDALGKFIYEFSQLETTLFLYLVVTSRMHLNDAKAVFTDAKIDKAKETVKRLREARGLAEDQQLNLAFNQIAEVTRLRNDLVHYGPKPQADGSFEVSDGLWKLRNPRTYKVTFEDVLAAMRDAITIKNFLMTHMLMATISGVPIIDAMPKTLPLPWQYKSSQPVRPPNSTQSKPRKRSRY